jgi:FG-GAP-like repeat/RTX calcium-binding nonapeptide repeat (4 copies)
MAPRRSVLRTVLVACFVVGLIAAPAAAYQTDSGVTFASCPDVTRGTAAPDTYGPWISTTARKAYDGLGGQDQIWGSDGADCLFGSAGPDTINSGNNADVISGGEGSDQVQAGGGNDDIDALEGRTHAQTGMDSINAGDGDDDVKADDGVADTIDCGPGQDRVDADAVDTVLASCEQRTDLTIDTPISSTDSVLFGDVDGDGRDDLVTVSSTGIVTVRRSDGVDAFGDPATWLTWNGASGVTLGDVDADGDKDLIGRTGTSTDVRVALSSGAAFAAPTTWLAAAPVGTLRAADIDGSGTDDLIIVQTSGSVQQAYADAGSFNEIGAMASLPAGSAPLFGDVDGDGLADLVLASAGRMQVRLSDSALFGAATDWGAAPPGDLAVNDADGDSLADLLVRGSDGNVRYLASSGGAFGAAASTTALPIAYSFDTADIDGDGRADAVGRSGAAVAVRIGGAPVPESDGTPWQPGSDAPEDPDGPPGLVAPQVVPGTPMALAWSDDDLTDQQLQAVAETDPTAARRRRGRSIACARPAPATYGSSSSGPPIWTPRTRRPTVKDYATRCTALSNLSSRRT